MPNGGWREFFTVFVAATRAGEPRLDDGSKERAGTRIAVGFTEPRRIWDSGRDTQTLTC